MNHGTSGNLSIRSKKGMIITPSSIPFEQMSCNDLIEIEVNRNKQMKEVHNPLNRRPSSESNLHADIYINRPEINAVLHCHSIHATALACHKKNIPSFHYMIAIAGGDNIRCAPYSTFGTREFSKNAVIALEGRLACLLANHGQLTIASDLKTALNLAIQIETLSHMYLEARQLGEPDYLSSEEMRIVINKFKTLGYGLKT